MKKTARPPDTLVEGANIKFTWRLQVFRPFILKVFHACNYTNSPSTYFTHFIIFTIFWQIMSCKHIRCFLFIHWHYFAIKLRLLSVCVSCYFFSDFLLLELFLVKKQEQILVNLNKSRWSNFGLNMTKKILHRRTLILEHDRKFTPTNIKLWTWPKKYYILKNTTKKINLILVIFTS